MKDTEKERQHNRERAWNRPLSARSRTTSHTGSAGHSPGPSSGQSRSTPDSASHSREHSRPPSPSESVRSRTAEGEENYERERNWGSPHQKWDHQHHPPVSPIPGPSRLHSRIQSTHSNGLETRPRIQGQSQRLRRNPSQSSLHSESSSRPSSPADRAHRRQTGRKDDEEEAIHERESKWGSRQQKWTHSPAHNRVASPNPTISHSRARTQSLESDSSVPPTSILTRPPAGLLKGRPSEYSLPASAEYSSFRHTEPLPEAPDEMSVHPVSTSPRSKPVNGHTYDKPLRLPSRLPRPDSPLISSVNGNSAEIKGASPAAAAASRFGWQFPRNRPQLPDFEPDTSSPERSPSPEHRPTSRVVGSGKPSHIPVRSPGQVPKIEIKRNDDVRTFTKGHKRATTEFTEANGAVPPKIHFQPEPELELTSEPESTDVKSLRGLLSLSILP